MVIIATLHHQKSKMITLLWHRVSRERTRFVSGNGTPHLHDSIALVMGATRNIETEISSLPPHRACANERLSLKPVATQARHMFDRISHSASADHQDTFETMLQTCSEPFSRVKFHCGSSTSTGHNIFFKRACFSPAQNSLLIHHAESLTLTGTHTGSIQAVLMFTHAGV
ncbi:hypothetical protein IQ06DRAFT_308428 [Phaeosphaeriaceae sp. SRC1lsM3a]|nr:hypothetical protein IQ06DRAFT_308428 [Stagonospora sp. SRC1lsM3a]